MTKGKLEQPIKNMAFQKSKEMRVLIKEQTQRGGRDEVL